PRERGRISDLHGALLAARDEVADDPGVVAAPLRVRRRDRTSTDADSERSGWVDPSRATSTGAQPHEDRDDTPDAEPKTPPDRWPIRVMTALAAAAIAVWLAVHVLGSAPLPPALVGFATVVAMLVAPSLGWMALTAVTVVLAVIEGHSGLALMTLLALSL